MWRVVLRLTLTTFFMTSFTLSCSCGFGGPGGHDGAPATGMSGEVASVRYRRPTITSYLLIMEDGFPSCLLKGEECDALVGSWRVG